MAKYWCRYFDVSNQLVRAERVVAFDDAAAIAKARACAVEPIARFEVWRNVNLIHEEARKPSALWASERSSRS